MTPWPAELDNPWNGVNAWRELLFDILHPVRAWKRSKAGLQDGVRFMQNGFKEW